jgi:putative transposase
VEDIFIACIDGLKGFPEAIELMFPNAIVQLCIVHMVRHSMEYVLWKQRREVAADLRSICTSATAEGAELALDQFAGKWDASHPTISQILRRNRDRIKTRLHRRRRECIDSDISCVEPPKRSDVRIRIFM